MVIEGPSPSCDLMGDSCGNNSSLIGVVFRVGTMEACMGRGVLLWLIGIPIPIILIIWLLGGLH